MVLARFDSRREYEWVIDSIRIEDDDVPSARRGVRPAHRKTMSSLATRTPEDIDTELAGYLEEAFRLTQKLARAVKEFAYWSEKAATDSYYSRQLPAMQENIDTLRSSITALDGKAEPLEAEFDRRPWTRAFLVIGTGDGHVHRSRSCRSCFPSTEFHWLPEQSGKDEDAIVEAGGSRCCTICYPSAPAWVLNKPTEIFSRDEKERAERRVERERVAAEKTAIKKAKTVTHPAGIPVYGPYDREATNITAVTSGAVYFVQEALQDAAYEAKDPDRYADSRPEWVAKRLAEREQRAAHLAINLEALAAFNGISIDEQTDIIREKALTKHLKGFGYSHEPKFDELTAELKALRAKAKARKAAE